MTFFLRIYDWFSQRQRLLFVLLGCVCAVLLTGMLSLGRNENILDFLPVDTTHRKALNLYQNISASDRIVALVFQRDTTAEVSPEQLIEAVDRFAEETVARDSLHTLLDLTTRIDYERFAAVPEFLYAHIPYFLDEADYTRIDSLLTPQYIDEQIAHDRMLLMFPTGSLLSQHVQQDPLNLFTPVVSRLQQFQSDLKYEVYDGYILTPDQRRAIVTMRTPYGSNETDNNARLVEMLMEAASATQLALPTVEIHLMGAPVIAVTNARQIKSDSFRAIFIAVVFILVLLLYTLRSLRTLLLIGVTIIFGWLFAMGCLSLFRSEVSMIILGIASIIIGIAVNYPLHLLTHLQHQQDMRSALREIVSPLVIGNLSTVGAFLCLVPMTAPALRDLGLFAAFMLVGTIFFVLIFLPHLVGGQQLKQEREHALLEPFTRISFDNRPRIFLLICLLTVGFGLLSRHTVFDTDLQNINYMSHEQRADLETFRMMLGEENLTTIYVASEGRTWDEALQRSEQAHSALTEIAAKQSEARLKSATPFLPSQVEQQRRLARWEQFQAQYAVTIREGMSAALHANGFHADAFIAFEELLEKRFEPMDWSAFEPLTAELFSSFLSGGDGVCTVVDRLDVPPAELIEVEQNLHERIPGSYNFDIRGMNSAISNALTGDFNYICWSCGLIVFLFLWFSFGRLELSLIAFLPMTASWLWILGIMELADIRFNLVNIILATFIFGQGDDYTIFITEGLIYEHAYGRKLLRSYKKSIVVSAMIMLIGIGTLIFSRHPAMRSLAEVTIIGMFAVVLMAYIIPPFIYRWLIRDRAGNLRRNPITLKRLFATFCLWGILVLEQIAALLLLVFTGLNRRKLRLLMHRMASWNLRHLPGVQFRIQDDSPTRNIQASGNILTCPAYRSIIVAHYHSPLDLLILTGCFEGTVIATDRKLPRIWAMLLRMTHSLISLNRIHDTYDQKTRLAIFADEMLDFETLLTPVGIHGSNDILPEGALLLSEGILTIAYEAQVGIHASEVSSYMEILKNRLHQKYADTAYFQPQILARYLYKGLGIESRSRRLLRTYNNFLQWIDTGVEDPEQVVIINNGQGEFGLLYALVHPQTKVYAFEQDADLLALAQHAGELPSNLRLALEDALRVENLKNAKWYLYQPTKEQITQYQDFAPDIIQ